MLGLLSKAKVVLATVCGFIVLLAFTALGFFKRGQAAAEATAAVKDLTADREANRRMNDADIGTGDTDADLKWLRERGKRAKRRPR